MSEAIKSILGQQGWQEVEEILRNEIIESKKLTDIKVDDKSNEQLGELVRARKEAARIIEKVISKVYREGTTVQAKKESYK